MGKNKRAAKAAWRAAATAAMHPPPVTSPAPSLVAPVITDEAPAAFDSKETTPAPTQQPRNVHTQDVCPPPRTSSLAPHTASASSNAAPTSPSRLQLPSATPNEPQKPPAATKRDSREVRTVTANLAPCIVPTASHSPTSSTHDSHTQPSSTVSPNAAEKKSKEGPGLRADEVRTENDAHGGSTHAVRTTVPLATPTHTATPRDSRTPPRSFNRPHTAANAPADRASARTGAAHDTRRANPHTTSPAESPASRTRTAAPRDVPAPISSVVRTSATAGEPRSHCAAQEDDPHDPNVRTAPHASVAPTATPVAPSSAHHDSIPPTPGFEPGEPQEAAAYGPHEEAAATRTAILRDSTKPPRSPIHPPTAVNKPAALAGARPGDTHGTRGTNVLPTSRTLIAIVPDVPASMLNNSKTPAPGFEPGTAHAAAALLFEEPDGELLNPAYLKEIVATALREGHAAGLKEGRNAGFREGLEAGKKTGRAEGREEGLQEGLKRSRLEASQDTCITSPIPHPPLAAAPRVSSIDAIDEQLLREIRFTAYNSGFEHGFTLSDKELESAQSVGFAKGCEEESRRWQDRRPEQANAQTETTMPLTILQVDAHTQTCSPSANIPPPASFSWADEADSLPIHSVLPLPPPRDFSVLRSSLRSPFGSLQRRARRSHRADLRPPRLAFLSAPVITRRHPAGLRAGRPSIMQVSSSSSGFAVPLSPLSWDGDPRLVELSRVLQSLGWVRESFG